MVTRSGRVVRRLLPADAVAQGDVPYLDGIQATLNDAIRRAASATGATYVDFSAVSVGHDACQAIGVAGSSPWSAAPTS